MTQKRRRKGPLRVCLVASEAAPYAVTNGVGDFVCAMARELEAAGHDVRVVLPLYSTARRLGAASDMGLPLQVPLGSRTEEAGVWQGRLGRDVPVYLIAQDKYFDREGLYRTANRDYVDNAERFSFLSRAALVLCRTLDWRPSVVHANDWQTGLVPAYMRTALADDAFWAGVPSVFTIHHLAEQGIFPQWDLRATGLPGETFAPAGLEFFGRISFAKAGIVYSDSVTVTSRRWAREIQHPEAGCGFDAILRQHADKLEGVLSGVTYNSWDPATDSHIAANYDLHSLPNKEMCKADLVETMGLESAHRVPLVGMISPLRADRGFDLLFEAFNRLMRRKVAMVVMGRGEPQYRDYLNELAASHAGSFAFIADHDPILAHKIIAGSDLFLIPSRTEPSAANHAYAMRYGTVPVVHATGVLDDGVRTFDGKRGTGNGFKFREYSASHLLSAMRKALDTYSKRRRWRKLVINAMNTEFAWKQAAQAYVKLYETAAGQRRVANGNEE